MRAHRRPPQLKLNATECSLNTTECSLTVALCCHQLPNPFGSSPFGSGRGPFSAGAPALVLPAMDTYARERTSLPLVADYHRKYDAAPSLFPTKPLAHRSDNNRYKLASSYTSLLLCFQRKHMRNMLVTAALEITCCIPCIPLLFPFVLHDSDMHLNGMLVDNFPTIYARQCAETLESSTRPSCRGDQGQLRR
jgi:hypothetical protein